MEKKIFISILFILFVSSFSFAQTLNDEVGNYDVELLQYGIRFSPPAGWQKIQYPGATTPKITFRQPHQKANIVLGLPKNSNTVSFELAMIMIRTSSKPLSEEKITFLNAPCYVFISQNTKKAGIVKMKGYHFIKNGKAYSIIYGARIAEFDNYLPIFEKALATFEILE